MQHAHCLSRVIVIAQCSNANIEKRDRLEDCEMIRGEIGSLEHAHACINACLACDSFSFSRALHSSGR